MKITEIKISSFQDFELYTNRNSKIKNIRLFRGQEDEKWDLDSELFRLVSKHKNFKKTLDKLGRNLDNKTDWELLSLGRHYGLLGSSLKCNK